MQKFNKISQYSNVIKNLLANTYLPLMRSVREGDYICKDRIYIFRCEVIKCTSSGYIGSAGFLSNRPIASWIRLQEFHFGDKDGKLSTNYVSNSEGYDFKTHERFGQYLRNLRDMYGLNLMPLYNCFSNQPLENHVIDINPIQHKNPSVIRNYVTQTSKNTNTKVYKVPIRFNQDYTICIENIGTTTIAPAFLRHNRLLLQNNTIYGNDADMTNQYIALHKGSNIFSYANTNFGKPIKVRFENKPCEKTITTKVLEPGTPRTGYRETTDDLMNIPLEEVTKRYYKKVNGEYQEIPKLPIIGIDINKLNEQVYWEYDPEQGPTGNVIGSIDIDCVDYDFFFEQNEESVRSTSLETTVESQNIQLEAYTEIETYTGIANNNIENLEWILEEDFINKLYLTKENAEIDFESVANIIGFWIDTEDPEDPENTIKVYEEYEQPVNIIKTISNTYSIEDEVVNQYADLEDNFYLLIQVPAVFNQNIVVLEGDYTRLESQKLVDYLVINELPDFLFDKYYTHNLNLMTATSIEPRPFSPTLVEFILWNAISTLDTINNDMDRLSLEMSSKYIPNTTDVFGMLPNYWVPRYRQFISDYITFDRNITQDNLGYVTTDIEQYINGDQ